jgi:8-oxo-dGTP pyrophosphatase MutT (NUDIX family)
MTQELLFVVDENNNPLEPLPRSEVIAQRLWRRTAGGILIHKPSKTVLCQKRSDSKDERPGLWIAEFGGKSAPGEDSKVTAVRELQEELGIVVDVNDMIFHSLVKSEDRRQFEYQYCAYWEGNQSEVVFDPNEISEIAWKAIPEVINLLENDPRWYSYGYEVTMLAQLVV